MTGNQRGTQVLRQSCSGPRPRAGLSQRSVPARRGSSKDTGPGASREAVQEGGIYEQNSKTIEAVRMKRQKLGEVRSRKKDVRKK